MTTEKRLIYANALQLEPDPWGGMNGVICLGRSGGKTMATVQAALRAMIENAPTVDAVEVVHGRWQEHRPNVYECTACNTWYGNYGGCEEWAYCPHCGAKMDGGNQDG